MANGDNPTEKEHFIPRMYLRGFSEVKEFGKALIWQFNLKTMQQTPVQVQKEKRCSNYRIYKDLDLNPGNINSWLKDGDGTKVSFHTAERILDYLVQHE
mgnify:CR=1 FL=1